MDWKSKLHPFSVRTIRRGFIQLFQALSAMKSKFSAQGDSQISIIDIGPFYVDLHSTFCSLQISRGMGEDNFIWIDRPI